MTIVQDALSLVERARLTDEEREAKRGVLWTGGAETGFAAQMRNATEAQLAKALQEFAKEDIDTCPCKRCVMIRSVIDSDNPNTAGLTRLDHSA